MTTGGWNLGDTQLTTRKREERVIGIIRMRRFIRIELIIRGRMMGMNRMANIDCAKRFLKKIFFGN